MKDVQNSGNHIIEPAERTAIEITVASSIFLTKHDHAMIKMERLRKIMRLLLILLFNILIIFVLDQFYHLRISARSGRSIKPVHDRQDAERINTLPHQMSYYQPIW